MTTHHRFRLPHRIPHRAVAVLAVVVVMIATATLAPARTAAAGPGDPIGNLEGPSVRLGHTNGAFIYVVYGWAADPDAPGQPTTVHLYVNGKFTFAIDTAYARPDVQAAHPWAGPNAGYAALISNRYFQHGTGPVTVCAYAINAGAGSTNTTLGCQTIPRTGPDGGEPIGSLDEVTVQPGLVHLRGWAGDRDAAGVTVETRVYVDGQPTLSMFADELRPDVPLAHPLLDGSTGFDEDLPIPPGVHTICAYAGNEGRIGLANTTLGCAVVDVPGSTPVGDHDPRGNLDVISTYPFGGAFPLYFAKGWAFDPDTSGPWTVRVRAVFGDSFQLITLPVQTIDAVTSKPRPDVEAAYPAAGPQAGFEAGLSMGKYQGMAWGCAYAVQAGPGAVAETFLGCRKPQL